MLRDQGCAYDDAIYASQRRWYDGAHDVWPWVGYLADVLAASYARFGLHEARGRQSA